MKRVLKYPFEIEDRWTFQVPQGSELVHVEVQNGANCAWFLVDESMILETMSFRIFGTGHVLSSDVALRHVASWQAPPFVWHMFEEVR